MFVEINSLSQFRNMFKDNKLPLNVREIKWKNFTIFNYTHIDNDMMNDILWRECRGICFKDEKLVSRPFHKFYNREELTSDFSESPIFASIKHDGSMVRPLFDDDKGIVLATRAGSETEVAIRATKFLRKKENYLDFISKVGEEYTPIFEYCAPDNRIVVKYTLECLYLLGVRENFSGKYLNRKKLEEICEQFNIPLTENAEDVLILKNVKQHTEIEGVVFHFGSGELVKSKTEWYVNRHRVSPISLSKKAIMKLYFDNKLDDMMGYVKEIGREKEVKDLVNSFNSFVNTELSALYDFFSINKIKNKKDFAIKVNSEFGKQTFKKSVLFNLYNKKLDSNRKLFQTKFLEQLKLDDTDQ